MSFSNYDKGSLILPMDGSNGGTTFTDWSLNTKIVTANGNAQTSTAQSKFYGSSGLFDGTGDFLAIPDSNDFDFGTGDFTISVYARFTAHTSIMILVGNYLNSTTGFAFQRRSDTNTLAFSNGDTIITSQSWTPTDGIWYHLAITRNGTDLRVFVDGTQIGATTTNSTNITGSTNSLLVGALFNGSYILFFNGHMNDLLIIKGAALWTANFTPPTRLIGEITGNVKDINGTNASRIITACPRTNPTRSFSTISDAGTGNYTLRVPATEVSRIALADEVTLYNDIVDRILVV